MGDLVPPELVRCFAQFWRNGWHWQMIRTKGKPVPSLFRQANLNGTPMPTIKPESKRIPAVGAQIAAKWHVPFLLYPHGQVLPNIGAFKLPLSTFEQGSLHYTPEHCLVNGGVPSFWRMGKMYLLRSPVEYTPFFFRSSV